LYTSVWLSASNSIKVGSSSDDFYVRFVTLVLGIKFIFSPLVVLASLAPGAKSILAPPPFVPQNFNGESLQHFPFLTKLFSIY
jgi:hypothetical protein